LKKITLELNELESELTNLQEQHGITKKNVQKMEDEVEEIAKQVGNKRQEYEDAKSELDQKRENLTACDKSISGLSAERTNLIQKQENIDIDLKKVDHRITRFHKDQKEFSNTVKLLQQKHTWIETEKKNSLVNHKQTMILKLEIPKKRVKN